MNDQPPVPPELGRSDLSDERRETGVAAPIADRGPDERAKNVGARTGQVAILGVGRLAEVVGPDEAREFFDEREARKRFLYTRAVQRWSGSSASGPMAYRRRRQRA